MNATDLDRPAPAGTTPPGAASGDEHSELAFIQIAFAGHNRSEDLGDPRRVSAGLKALFELLRRAGVRRARLVTGMARGADLLAARAWKAAGLGPIHAVFPFLDDDLDVRAERLIESSTWLDGASTQALGRNGYLAQTRWLINAADLLVVVWTGEHARGAGGTADAVRLALEHGIPVLWLKPGARTSLKLIRPEHLDEDFGFLEFLEELRVARAPLVRPATPENLREALVELGFGVPDSDRSGQEEGAPAPISALARTYSVFRRTLGGRGPPFAMKPVPSDLLRQPGFQRLTLAQASADAHANALGALHRSHQVILLGIMILAAVAGSASSMWPIVKLPMVAIELILALGALAIWRDSERGNRHHRWGEARRLAEDLRLERVAWVLGVGTAPHGVRVRHSHTDRRLRRQVGLPHAAYTPARVAEWGAWAVDELIAGQAAYHRGQALINGRVSHRVHQVEDATGGMLMVILATYLVVSLALTWFGRDEPHWFDGLVALAGAIVPAITAAGLALEATLALNEESQRSRVLAARLDVLSAAIGDAPALETLQAAAKAAIRLQRAQEDHWTEGTVRRRLFRGG
jgi:hypothetical protein